MEQKWVKIGQKIKRIETFRNTRTEILNLSLANKSLCLTNRCTRRGSSCSWELRSERLAPVPGTRSLELVAQWMESTSLLRSLWQPSCRPCSVAPAPWDCSARPPVRRGDLKCFNNVMRFLYVNNVTIWDLMDLLMYPYHIDCVNVVKRKM